MTQTSLNPDISVIGDFRGLIVDRPAALGMGEKSTLELHEVELAAEGYLNPYARADVYFAWHGEHAEVEEAFVTFERGLPWGLSARAGRYLTEFGRLNQSHPHAWPFIDRPLVHQAYLGDEGFSDDGVSLRWLLPVTSVYLQLSADLLRGNAFITGAHHNHEHEGEDEVAPDKGFLSHLTMAGATGEYSETGVGLSAAYGNHDPAENLSSMLVGLDLKHRWRPDRYTSLTVLAEAVINRREMHREDHHDEVEGEDHDHEAHVETVSFFGGYASADYQFWQRYNIGGKFDYYEPFEDQDNPITRYQLFAGFAPVEETTLIRVSGYYHQPSVGDGVYGATVQLVFLLGPHRSHAF